MRCATSHSASIRWRRRSRARRAGPECCADGIVANPLLRMVDAEHRVQSRRLKINLLDQRLLHEIVSGDPCRPLWQTVGLLEAVPHPIDVLAQCRVADAREPDPGLVALWQQSAAPPQRT